MLFTQKQRLSQRSYAITLFSCFALYAAARIGEIFILGPRSYQQLVTQTSFTTGETTQFVRNVIDYGPQWISVLTAALIFLPVLIVAVGRAHDIGYSGFLATGSVFLVFLAGPALGYFVQFTWQISQGLVGLVAAVLGFPQYILFFLALLLLIAWAFAPSEPHENEYGPNPNEVSS